MEMVPLRWTRFDAPGSIEFDVQFSFITYFQQVIYLIIIVQMVNEQVEVEI